MTKPVVYVAGPYSHPDPVANTREAINVADRLLDWCIPLIPHLSLAWHLASPKSYEEWLEIGLAWLCVCDALYRFPGKSAGADAEVELALARGIPVLTSMVELRSFVNGWKP